MSISTEISRLQLCKTNIRNALIDKKITTAGSHNFSDFAADILAIKGGIAAEEAIIAVTANSGSTVLSSPSLEFIEHTINSSLSIFVSHAMADSTTYTVSVGNRSSSITVSYPIIYEANLSRIYLFNGEASDYVCTSVTGGWAGYSGYTSSTIGTIETNIGYNRYKTTGAAGQMGQIYRTINEINLTGFSTLTYTFAGCDAARPVCLGIVKIGNSILKGSSVTTSTKTTSTYDISNLNGSYAVGMCASYNAYSGGQGRVDVYSMYME